MKNKGEVEESIPNISPMTSIGIPARPCFNIFNNDNDDICIFSDVSGSGVSAAGPPPPRILPSIR